MSHHSRCQGSQQQKTCINKSCWVVDPETSHYLALVALRGLVCLNTPQHQLIENDSYRSCSNDFGWYLRVQSKLHPRSPWEPFKFLQTGGRRVAGWCDGLERHEAGPLQNHSATKRLHAEDKCKESKTQTENDPATTSAMQSCGKHMNRNESMRPRHSAKQSSRRHSRTFVQVKQDQKHS